MPSKSGSIMSSTTASGRCRFAVATALAAVQRDLDVPALVAQRHPQQLGDVLLVVDDQHAQGSAVGPGELGSCALHGTTLDACHGAESMSRLCVSCERRRRRRPESRTSQSQDRHRFVAHHEGMNDLPPELAVPGSRQTRRHADPGDPCRQSDARRLPPGPTARPGETPASQRLRGPAVVLPRPDRRRPGLGHPRRPRRRGPGQRRRRGRRRASVPVRAGSSAAGPAHRPGMTDGRGQDRIEGLAGAPAARASASGPGASRRPPAADSADAVAFQVARRTSGQGSRAIHDVLRCCIA